MAPELLSALEEALGGPVLHVSPLGPRGRTFEIEHANTRYVAKRFETPGLAQTEAAILRHLRGSEDPRFEVPPVQGVYTLASVTVLVTFKRPGELRHWRTLNAADWRALGGALAALHAALLQLQHPLPSQQARLQSTSEQQLLERLDAQSRALSSAQSDPQSDEHRALVRYVEDCRVLVRKFYSACVVAPAIEEQPIHNDFNQYNYRFRTDAPLLVTDWERAIRAPTAFEVARVLNHIPLLLPERAVAFIQGYAQVAPLSTTALRRSSRLYLLGLATKFWPLQGWLEGDAQLGKHALANARMVRTIREDLGGFLAFYERVLCA